MVIKPKERKRKRSLSLDILTKEKLVLSPPDSLKGSPVKDETLTSPSSSSTVEDAASQVSLDCSRVRSGVEAVLKLISLDESKSSLLFSEEGCPIHLQIACVKVPITPERQLRLTVPYTLVTDLSSVCLFVPDLQKGKRKDHEPTIAHYQDVLERNGVRGITQVIPMRQLKVEYDQYELKRRLCGQFDHFLADSRVSNHIRRLLGKQFFVKRKFPTPVRLDAKDLKEEFTRALARTVLHIHGRSNCFTMKVAHSKMSVKQITKNVLAVAEGLARDFPGGWSNIRSMNLKAPYSMSVPIYLTLKSPNSLDAPIVKPKKPKAAVPVEGELTTFLGARVKVMPDGTVIVTKDKDAEEDSDTELNEIIAQMNKKRGKKRQKVNAAASVAPEDDGESDGELDPISSRQAKREKRPLAAGLHSNKKKKKKKMKGSDESEDEGESDIEEAEASYFSHLIHEREELAKAKEEQNKAAIQDKEEGVKKGKSKWKVEKHLEEAEEYLLSKKNQQREQSEDSKVKIEVHDSEPLSIQKKKKKKKKKKWEEEVVEAKPLKTETPVSKEPSGHLQKKKKKKKKKQFISGAEMRLKKKNKTKISIKMEVV